MFSRALYYPTIDIKNEWWLKSAALFWDSIETIVPLSKSENPYENSTARALYENNVLQPHVVDPWSDEVAGLEDDVRQFIGTREGKRLLHKRLFNNSLAHAIEDGRESRRRFLEDMGERLRQQYDDLYIHADKLPHFLQDDLRRYRDQDGFVLTTVEFLRFYMTLLANNICRREGLSLLTDKVMANDLTTMMLKDKIGVKLESVDGNNHLHTVFYNIVLENIHIDPKTPVEKIIDFKRRYADELGRFRMEVSQLTNIENVGENYISISEQAKNIYENGVIPSMNDLKKALNGATIKWTIDHFYNYVLSGVAPAAMTLVNMPMMQMLPISAGLTIGYTLLGRWMERREIMRNSPYAYLLRTKGFSI